MLQRALYLLKTYLLTVLIFVAAKPIFMLCNAGGRTFSAADVLDVLRHGLSLDLSMALYFIIMPFLCVVVTVFTGWNKVLEGILKVYYVVISIMFALAFVADTSLYEFWLFKLDASCLQYLETPTEAMASVSKGYIVVRLLIVILLCYVFFMAYTLPRWKISPSRHRFVESLIALLLIPCLIIGIRGGLSESTTNIGQVYFSQNQFLNHAAVNPVFSFFASFEKSASNNTVYHYMDDEACAKIIREHYNTQSIGCDSLLNTQTPNIILILLEGCGGTFTEIAGRQDVTPNLNRLAEEGIYFTNCYGNTWRTDRGTVCTWSGYPSFPTMSVMKIPSKSRTLPHMARTLKNERNYSTHYIYGGDINFTNMRSYLISGGFQTLKWKADYSREEQRTSQWGVCDEITFKSLFEATTTLSQPFLIGFSTLSSHAPWDVPIQHFDDEILNAFYYLDQCLGNFIDQFRQTETWNNTLVILLPDHGIPYQNFDERHPLTNHIPMIWTGGAVKEPRRIEQVCNQTDLAATLLGQLGLPHDDFTFSRDVMSSTYTRPFAINTYTEGFSVVDSVSFLNYDLISNRVDVEIGKKNPELETLGKAILQAASKDLNER